MSDKETPIESYNVMSDRDKAKWLRFATNSVLNLAQSNGAKMTIVGYGLIVTLEDESIMWRPGEDVVAFREDIIDLISGDGHE